MKDATELRQFEIDLPSQKITRANGSTISFDVDPFKKHCLINGLDDIGLSLQKDSYITKFEEVRRTKFSFLEAARKKVSELPVTSAESVDFYVKAALELLSGCPSKDGSAERLPSVDVIVSGEGSGIPKAASVANELEANGDATIARTQTLLVD